MRTWCGLSVLALICLGCAWAQENRTSSKREGKLFSFFQVVRFENTGCAGTASKNGTCYTADECTKKGGTSSGNCAGGYGVCCVFSLTCGGTSSQNCTYFESTGTETGNCIATICKANANICQIRLDFMSFVLADPSASQVVVGKAINGQMNQLDSGVSVTTASQCLTDMFSVTNPGGSTPPTICGTNNSQHMYVDASDACNTLGFGLGTTTTARSWSIKITQYSCDFNNLAPSGCTQYFYGSLTGIATTYNYGTGKEHLANQNQNICVRKEKGICRICWSGTADADVQVNGMAASGSFAPSQCCGYGAKGSATVGYDCLTIPGASKATGPSGVGVPQRVCGKSKGLVSAVKTTAVSICSKSTPFSIRFISDTYETTAEAIATQKGASIGYVQSACK